MFVFVFVFENFFIVFICICIWKIWKLVFVFEKNVFEPSPEIDSNDLHQ